MVVLVFYFGVTNCHKFNRLKKHICTCYPTGFMSQESGTGQLGSLLRVSQSQNQYIDQQHSCLESPQGKNPMPTNECWHNSFSCGHLTEVIVFLLAFSQVLLSKTKGHMQSFCHLAASTDSTKHCSLLLQSQQIFHALNLLSSEGQNPFRTYLIRLSLPTIISILIN